MSAVRRAAAAAFTCLLAVSLIPAATANADCNNPGDFGASSGCPPPGDTGTSSVQSWPPTSVDWPPKVDTGSDSGGNDATKSAHTPIVMPAGQTPTPVAPAGGTTPETTTATPTPIVPVGGGAAAPASPTATPIVAVTP
jgi:hypothetical protein